MHESRNLYHNLTIFLRLGLLWKPIVRLMVKCHITAKPYKLESNISID